MREEFQDKVTHSYLEAKKVRKSYNEFVDKYRDIFDSETEDRALKIRKDLYDLENDLFIEVRTSLG